MVGRHPADREPGDCHDPGEDGRSTRRHAVPRMQHVVREHRTPALVGVFAGECESPESTDEYERRDAPTVTSRVRATVVGINGMLSRRRRRPRGEGVRQSYARQQ